MLFVIKTQTTFAKNMKIPLFMFSHSDKKKQFFKINEGKEIKQPIVYPHQYPSNPLTHHQPIISRQRPVKHTTPKFEVPDDKMMMQNMLIKETKYNGKWKSPQNSYTLNVGLIGPVNAGKSELFGALAHRFSAVSPKASTTTEVVTGLKSFQKENEQGVKNIQLQYFDTPGLMYKKEGFLSKGWKVLSEIDFSLLVVDSAKRFDDMIMESIKRLEKHRQYPKFMKSLVLNKIDLVDNRRKFDSLIREIEKYGKFDKVFYVSAKTGYGISELEQYLLKMAKPGVWQYPAQAKTTMTQLQIFEEMLRQAIFNRTYKEVPHQTLITCTSFSKLTNDKDEIIFDIYIETENQQRMVIGKSGNNIKEAIDKFKLLYAKMYQREAIPIVSVKITNKFMKMHRGREQTIIRDQDQQDQQKVEILVGDLENKWKPKNETITFNK